MSEEAQAQVATEPTEGQAPEVEQQGTQLEVPEEYKAELNKARREAAKYRKAAQAAQEAEELRQREEMSEVERLKADMANIQAQAQAAEAKAQAAMVKAAVMRAATDFNDPEDALRLLDLDSLEMGDDGTINGIGDAITALLKEKPYLSKKQGSVSPTNPASEPHALTYDEMKAQRDRGAIDTMFAGGGVLKQE